MKALEGAFNQEKALLVGAFSVIVKPIVKPMDRFAALLQVPEAQWRGEANTLRGGEEDVPRLLPL